MKHINCRISKVYLKSEDTLYIDIEQDQEFTAEDNDELKYAAKELGNGRRFYNLIKVGPLTIATKESLDAVCSVEGSQYKLADAYVISSLPQKLIGNIMLRVNRPVVPTKFFHSIQEAEDWLEEIRENSAVIAR